MVKWVFYKVAIAFWGTLEIPKPNLLQSPHHIARIILSGYCHRSRITRVIRGCAVKTFAGEQDPIGSTAIDGRFDVQLFSDTLGDLCF